MSVEIPGYQIVEKIGQGGNAAVFLAVQESLNRHVALKVVQSTLSADPKFGERFQREGHIVAQFSHPNIIPVYDVGQVGDVFFMAMEHLPGGDLRERLAHFTVGQLLKSVSEVARALHVAHQKGFIHRDIKPANILFRGDLEAVLTDFGIARQTQSLTQMTLTGALLGTPAYMSPEQIAGKELDGRTDLYALGITLFEALTGYQPYRSESVMNVAMQHLNAALPQLPAASRVLQPLINRLLAKEPSDRLIDAAELAKQMDALLIEEPLDLSKPLTSLWPDSPPPADATMVMHNQTTHMRRAPKMFMGLGIGLGLALALLLVAGGLWSYLRDSSEPTNIISPWAAVLEQAKKYEDVGQLVSPAETNALALYRQVLASDPTNILANEGEANIRATLMAEANEMLRVENFYLASQKIESLEDIWPNSIQIKALREEYVARIEAQQQLGRERRAEEQLLTLIETAQRRAERQSFIYPIDDSVEFYLNQAFQLSPQDSRMADILDNGISILRQRSASAERREDYPKAYSALDEARQLVLQSTQDTPAAPGYASLIESLRREAEMVRVRQRDAERSADIASNISAWRVATEEAQNQFRANNKSRAIAALETTLASIIRYAADNGQPEAVLAEQQQVGTLLDNFLANTLDARARQDIEKWTGEIREAEQLLGRDPAKAITILEGTLNDFQFYGAGNSLLAEEVAPLSRNAERLLALAKRELEAQQTPARPKPPVIGF